MRTSRMSSVGWVSQNCGTHKIEQVHQGLPSKPNNDVFKSMRPSLSQQATSRVTKSATKMVRDSKKDRQANSANGVIPVERSFAQRGDLKHSHRAASSLPMDDMTQAIGEEHQPSGQDKRPPLVENVSGNAAEVAQESSSSTRRPKKKKENSREPNILKKESDLEKASSTDVRPIEDIKTTTVPPVESQVDRYVREWQALNEATPADVDELLDSCLYSESIVVKALDELNPYQQIVFKRKLRELGLAVEDADAHHSHGLAFGKRLHININNFILSPEELDEARERARFTLQVRDWLDPTFAATRGNLSPRVQIYRDRYHQLLVEDKEKQFQKLLREAIARLGTSEERAEELLAEDGEPLRVSKQFESLTLGGRPTDCPSPTPANPEEQDEEALTSSKQSDPDSPFKNWPPIGFKYIKGIGDIEENLKSAREQLAKTEALRDAEIQPTTSLSRLQPTPSNTMAITTQVALPLPVLPEGWSGDGGKDFKAIGSLSKATQRSIEPVGPHFLAHARRARHKRTFSEDERIQAQQSVKKVEDDDDGEISEPEDPAMLMRDAKDWKGQDHYAVLGLSKYRWKATEEQIKRAHRKKVLRHHPDKKAAAGSTEDDSFFKCIQKATEILLDPIKRRQFDSVDEAADIEPPTKKQSQKGNFYKLWAPVFKAEGRFSRIQPVPKLGDENSTKEDVENFYNFWYNFDSWRSFEYQDEDVPDDNENRDQKRHMERKNNNARKKKKTEDSARLRKLLDDCSSLDERIKKFRQEASASRIKKRLEREAAEKKAQEDAKAKKEAEEKAAKEAEEAAKAEREQGKKAKEAAKNAVKKNKRVLKGSVKDANYFVKGNAPAATINAVLNDVELVQGKTDPDEIAALASKLTGLKVADEIKAVWGAEVKRLTDAGKLKEGDAKTLVA